MALDYNGMHATCRTYADQILRSGFNDSCGRHGVGVYFWESSKDKPEIRTLARELSESFYEDRIRFFNSANDSSLSILEADITLSDESQILDFEEMSISQMFSVFIQKSKQLNTASNNDKQARINSSAIMLAFIKMVEEIRNSNILVIRVKTQAPTSFRQRLSRTFEFLNIDRQSCFVVRDKSVISNLQKLS
ncbi:hypothetical protein F993_01540 [Acinetobacter proteolyticus]|uniref:Uncharacterized protein n=1 Tax=Acinetobacter proteolyticus TaxID=1776741 RepID=A0ABN0JGA9_9GAMM|nr:hypothetical protein [Acinetobacter proteolyticus]ENU24224.1 hypothetical protein F993_01540 [Acinetobacter proteolyticus]